MSEGLEIRASDADRERIAARLQSATAEGRLSAEELDERLEAALSARTHEQLEALVADLPPTPSMARRPRGRAPLRRSDAQAWAATSVLLVAIWALTGMDYFWPVWPIAGWGVFALMPLTGHTSGGCGQRQRHRHHGGTAPG